jgi:hypothetical protein
MSFALAKAIKEAEGEYIAKEYTKIKRERCN